MNERDELPVVIAKMLVALLPVAVYVYATNRDEIERAIERWTYRARLASWRWRRWRRWSPEQRERYVELHGDPEPA